MTLPITKKAKGSMTKLEQCTRIVSNGYYDGKPSADIVRAVLTELLNPDVSAIGHAWCESFAEAEPERLYEFWQAMINHILTEGEG